MTQYYLAIDQARQKQKQLKNSLRRRHGLFPFDDNAYFMVCNRVTKKRIAEGLNFTQAQTLLDELKDSEETGR